MIKLFNNALSVRTNPQEGQWVPLSTTNSEMGLYSYAVSKGYAGGIDDFYEEVIANSKVLENDGVTENEKLSKFINNMVTVNEEIPDEDDIVQGMIHVNFDGEKIIQVLTPEDKQELLNEIKSVENQFSFNLATNVAALMKDKTFETWVVGILKDNQDFIDKVAKAMKEVES